MNPAQAARQEQGEEQQAANVSPERGRDERGREAASEVDVDHDEEDELDEHDELDELDELDEEEDIQQRTVELLSRVRQGIRRQPLTAATGAFIVGFAVGNGVPKFLARAGIAVGLRLVMARVLDRANLFGEEA